MTILYSAYNVEIISRIRNRISLIWDRDHQRYYVNYNLLQELYNLLIDELQFSLEEWDDCNGKVELLKDIDNENKEKKVYSSNKNKFIQLNNSYLTNEQVNQEKKKIKQNREVIEKIRFVVVGDELSRSRVTKKLMNMIE